MLLYHGSNIDIKEIDLAMCRPYKDFGNVHIARHRLGRKDDEFIFRDII